MIGRAGYKVNACPKMLILQFMEDLGDRELARFLAENTATKLFCDFSFLVKCYLERDCGMFFEIYLRAWGIFAICFFPCKYL